MASWLRIGLALVVGAHGIGHLLFLMPLLGVADLGQSTRSWLLGSNLLAKGAGSLIWIVATAGFIAVALGILNTSGWWRALAIASSAISIAGLVLFWGRPASSPALSALVFNLLVMGSLLVLHWPAAAEAAG
jgi:hypothetical protein